MPPILNISIGLIVFMGLASGGLLALVLMSQRKQQTSFSIMLGLSVLLAAGGVIASGTLVEDTEIGLANALVLLILSFTLGYTITTFSVLSQGKNKHSLEGRNVHNRYTAVIQLAPGEPPEYTVTSAARRLELADDPKDAPPILLRPFYMRDLKGKYTAIGSSPYRDYYIQLAQKVQARLDSRHRVQAAFYNDEPTLAQAVTRAVEAGARQIIVMHARVTNPPDPVLAGDLLEGLSPEAYGVQIKYAGPLWDSNLLAQIYVRRVLEALPQVNTDFADTGLLLVGRGHMPEAESSIERQKQEEDFQGRVRQALLKIGFDETRVAIGWLRQRPTTTEVLHALIEAGCKTVYWLPASFPADGINTLYDIPAQINTLARQKKIKLIPLGAWNADDLAAEEIAARVRKASDEGVRD